MLDKLFLYAWRMGVVIYGTAIWKKTNTDKRWPLKCQFWQLVPNYIFPVLVLFYQEHSSQMVQDKHYNAIFAFAIVAMFIKSDKL